MNIIHVFILFAVLWNATAQSGSDAGSGGESGGEASSGRGSGSDGVEEFNTNDIIRVIEEEVQREQFENGESVSSQTAEKMDDSSASGSGINHEPDVSHVDNEHPTHPLTKPIYFSRQTRLNSKQTSHQRQEISSPTVTPLQKPDKPLDTSLSKDAEKNTSNKSNHLTTHPRINPSVPTVPPSQMNIFRENSRSKYRHSYSENGFGTEEQDDANQGSRVEYAHLNKVVDEMKKLKKSKTDEELGEKIRSGAKQVMSSIANNLVTKTTQTVTPHIGHIIQRGLKFGSENPSKKIIVSFDKNNNEIYTKPTKQVSNTSLTRKSTAEDSKKKKVAISLLPKEHITTKRFSTVLKTDHNNPSTKSTQAEEQVVKTLFEVSKKTKAKTFGKTMIKVKVQPVYNKKGYKSPGKPGDNKRYLHFNGKQHNVENLGDFDGNVPVNTKLENAMQHRNVSEELRVNSKKKNLEKQGDFGRNKLKYENESMKQRNVANDVHEDSKQRYNIKQGTVDENVHVEPNMAAKQGVVPKHKQYKKQEHKNYEKLHDNERYMQVDGNQTNGEKQGNVEKDAYVDGKRKNSTKTGNVAAVNLPVDSKHTKTKMQGGFGKNVHKFGNAEDSVKHKGISRDHHLDRKPGNANTVEGDVERKVHVDNKYGIIKNMTRQHQKASKKDTHSNLVGVKVFDKNEYKPRNHDTKMTSHKTKGRIEKQIGLSSKPRQTESVKKGLVAELITSPTPLRSMLMTSEDDNTYQLKNSVQGPKSLTAESSSKHKVDILQNKVHHLENEVTVLQTAVAGLAQRLNYVENSVQEVSNVTQSEVIIGPTQMSTTPLPSSSPAPTQTPTSTQQPTSTFHPSTEQLSIQEQFLDNVLPTHQPSKSTFHFINKPSPSSEQFNQIAELPEQKPSTSTFHRVIKQSLLPEQFKELEEEQQQQQQQQRQRQRQRQQQMQQQQQQQLLRPITKPSILPEQFQITDLPASANEPRQPIITTHSEDNRHNLHQVIIPLETLYRMQTQEGIQVPDDNNYNSHDRNVLTENQLSLPQGGDLTAPNNDGPVASPMDASVENTNQRKVQIPLDQNQQSVAMNTLPGDGTTDSVVRPIVNIIVPNSQTASILEKEMCRVPCRNGGKCNGLNTCECPAFFQGPHCEQFALYDFIKNKAKQWPESSTKRNSLISNVRKPVQGRRISLSDLIQLGSTGTHFRLPNGHLFSLAEERGKTFLPQRLTKTRKAVKRKQYIVEI